MKTKEQMIEDLVNSFLNSITAADAEDYIRSAETRYHFTRTEEEIKAEWEEIFDGEEEQNNE